jgi:(p)ppGpp synthase/HD superfamily hydrolase
VLALEALQLYAPMGHAMGLGQLSSSIEDICFQVRNLLACSVVLCSLLDVHECRDLHWHLNIA